ncbi:response regulator [Mesorhizobium sp. B1-1-8]|uniref:response regulator n=1 Tax=Mesorhizobium sp. B1-1-8 TaxID=2589976 RepID=UPI001D0139B2|nr:response regulator [Mesorhizobium sp. B1-1-8]UCI10681.1 response regulator [Mesorhizobium sp. B1-1-8]
MAAWPRRAVASGDRRNPTPQSAQDQIGQEDEVRSLEGARILIVEDEFFIADDIARYFAGLGAEILGPVSSVAGARPFAERADAAVLDINLNGTYVFAIADRLVERGIPFVFFSGYERNIIPPRLEHIASLLKPAGREEIKVALFPDASKQDRSSDDALGVVDLLPKLRLAARLMLTDAGAADRLVEKTLEIAITEISDRCDDLSTEQWLNLLLKRLFHGGAHLLN